MVSGRHQCDDHPRETCVRSLNDLPKCIILDTSCNDHRNKVSNTVTITLVKIRYGHQGKPHVKIGFDHPWSLPVVSSNMPIKLDTLTDSV